VGKISSFAKMGVGLALAFCKCADVCWQKKRLEKRINFALGKGELFFIVVMFLCILDCTFHRIADNVLQLGEVAEIEAQMFSFAQKFNRRTAVEFSTKPAILPNCCYLLCLFYFFNIFVNVKT